MKTIAKPREGMFKPFSGAYISLINDNIDVPFLQTQFNELQQFVSSLPAEKIDYRYAEGKWTIKEMLLHMMDTERIFSYRALRIGRNDKTNLPGFDQEVFMPFCNAGLRTIGDILEEFKAIRQSTFLLFTHFDDAAWDRFTLVDNHPVNLRAMLYLIVGHAQHHINVIKEKYL